MTAGTIAKPTSGQIIPVKVWEFCEAHGIADHLHRAILLANAHFAPAIPVDIELDVDFETDDRRIVITSTVHQTPEEVVRRYQTLVAEWISTAPQSARYFFSFSYDIRNPE